MRQWLSRQRHYFSGKQVPVSKILRPAQISGLFSTARADTAAQRLPGVNSPAGATGARECVAAPNRFRRRGWKFRRRQGPALGRASVPSAFGASGGPSAPPRSAGLRLILGQRKAITGARWRLDRSEKGVLLTEM